MMEDVLRHGFTPTAQPAQLACMMRDGFTQLQVQAINIGTQSAVHGVCIGTVHTHNASSSNASCSAKLSLTVHIRNIFVIGTTLTMHMRHHFSATVHYYTCNAELPDTENIVQCPTGAAKLTRCKLSSLNGCIGHDYH